MSETLKYSIIMFIAGATYGFMVPLVRTAYDFGYLTPEIMVSQYLVGLVALCFICLIFSRKSIAPVDILKLLGVGIFSAGVSFFYYQAIQLLTPAAALTLLFQFVWMGMIVQAVRSRSLPKASSVIAVVLIIIGAIFATGLIDEGMSLESLNPLGIVFGLLSAVSYTVFLVLSSVVAKTTPALNRSLIVVLGSFGLSLAIAPTYLEKTMIVLDPVLAIVLGLFCICVPIVLISISAPKLPTGLTTIMASSELPSGVICAAIFLGDQMSLAIWLGVVIVLVGIVVSEFETITHVLQRAKQKKLNKEEK